MKRRYLMIVIAATTFVIIASCAATVLAGNITLGATDSARMRDATNAFVNRVLYKFAIPESLATVRVDRAVLRLPLTADTVIKGWGVVVFPSADRWTGSGGRLSYTDLQIVDAISAVHLTDIRPNKIMEMDITGLVRGWSTGLVANHGLVIESMLDAEEPMEIPGRLAFPTAGQVELEVWFAPSSGR